jgi:hypothetical protein
MTQAIRAELSGDPQTVTKSPVKHVLAMNTRPSETSDDYPDIVVMLDAKTRVIRCANEIQWIIQKRQGGPYPWRSDLFFRSKEGLLLYAPKPTAPKLLALPDWFSERREAA